MTVGNKEESACSGSSGMASLLLLVAPLQGAKEQTQIGLARELGGYISNIFKDAGLLMIVESQVTIHSLIIFFHCNIESLPFH